MVKATFAINKPEPTACIPQRYVFATLAAIGNAITYGLKVNLHVSLVTMVNSTEVSAHASSGPAQHESTGAACASDDAGSATKLMDGPFNWDFVVQGMLLSAYFYGYIMTQLIGGRLAELVSAKYTFGISLLSNVVLALVSPTAAHLGWPYLAAARVGQGMAGGVTLPTTHVLLARWAPIQERSKMSSIVYAGMSLGTVISVPLTGLLISAIDWQASFYIPAGLAMIPTIAWFFLVYENPEVHPWITNEEKQLIQGDRPPMSGPVPPLPWKALLKSKPFWAILVSHTGSNFGWYMILTELPTYMAKILGFAIKSNAILSAIPFLVMWLYSIFLGSFMDYLASKGYVNRTQITKIATSIAAFVPAVCLVAVSYVGCQKGLAVLLLTIATGAIGSMYSGFLSNHISIAPIFAGTLMATTNTIATLPGIIVPSFVGAMIEGNNTVEQWRIIFGVTSAIFVVHGLQYMFFASAEEEDWAKEARLKSANANTSTPESEENGQTSSL